MATQLLSVYVDAPTKDLLLMVEKKHHGFKAHILFPGVHYFQEEKPYKVHWRDPRLFSFYARRLPGCFVK